MKKTIIVLTIPFLLASCTGISQEDYDAANATITELESELNASLSENEILASDIDTLESDLETQETEYQTLVEENEELSSRVDDQRRQITSLTSEVSNYICDDTISNMSYGDILNSSTNLMAWVANQSWATRANSTIRDTIWNNTDTKLHGVVYTASEDNQQYLTWFLVYYDEFGWEEGVFWLDGQCWLDY